MHDGGEQRVELFYPHALCDDGENCDLQNTDYERAYGVFSVQKHRAIEQNYADDKPPNTLFATGITQLPDFLLGLR